jgi:hypothetical protein
MSQDGGRSGGSQKVGRLIGWRILDDFGDLIFAVMAY